MKKLTNQQIDFVIDKISINSNLSVTLKDDLIDHFCCIIENEMNKGKEFEVAYQTAYQSISPEGIEELGKEMMFLMNSKSKKRLIKLLRISGFSAMTSMFITVFMKTLQLPYAQIILLLTTFTTLFLFLPSAFTYFFKNSTKKNKWLYMAGFAGMFLLVVSLVFLITHWPGGRGMLAIAIFFIYIAIFPLFFYRIHKKTT